MRNFLKAFMLMVIIPVFPSIALAGTVELPRTGQTTCYDNNGNVISCTGTGQDGDWRAGVAWPSPRFTDNGDGTITDNLTGLIWLKDANCFGQRRWDQALSDANNLTTGQCGLTDNSQPGDWRLPNKKELMSLINYQEADTSTWLNGQGFQNAQQGYYWTSTSFADNPVGAWYVNLWFQYVGGALKSFNYYVWPVKGGSGGAISLPETGQTTCYDTNGNVISCTGTGQDGDWRAGVAWPSPRFTDNGDGTITDNLTGLIWLKDANCFGEKTNWTDALTSANTLNSGECGLSDGSAEGDWRLPNIRELESLTNAEAGKIGEWLAGQGFIHVQSGSEYWSSTTVIGNEAYAWQHYMSDGQIYEIQKSSNILTYVWPVRGGRLMYKLVISKLGSTGTGTVTSSPSGINCGSICSTSFNRGTDVILTATPGVNSFFGGWGGACSSCGTNLQCQITMDTDKTCIATFNAGIVLKYPNGGEVLASGNTETILWESIPSADHFNLKLSMDNGMTWGTIATNVTGNSYDWAVPVPANNKRKCLIKVIAFNSSNVKIGADRSDLPFTIEVVRLSSPNGGETLKSGNAYDITWTTNATKRPVARVKLFYTKDGGLTWNLINTLTGNPGTYTWTVPNVTTTKTKCRVKVVLKDSAGNTVGSDGSDSFFTITP